MTEDPRDELPLDVRDALAEHREPKPISLETKDRLYARIESSVVTTAPIGDGTRASTLSPSRIGRVAAFVLTFVAGAIVGIYLHAFFGAPEDPALISTPPSMPHVPDASVSDAFQLPIVVSDASVAAQSIAPTPSGHSHRDSDAHATADASLAQGRDTALAAERVAIEMARTALRRGDAAQAFDLLQQHQREFAQPLLREERDALFVLACASTQRDAEALARASRFHAEFPNSLLSSVVEHAVQSISSRERVPAPNSRQTSPDSPPTHDNL